MVKSTRGNVCISGLWLRSYGKRMQVLVEMAGAWYVVIDEYAPLSEQEISHIVEPHGIAAAVLGKKSQEVSDQLEQEQTLRDYGNILTEGD